MLFAARDGARKLAVGSLTASQAEAYVEAALAQGTLRFVAAATVPPPGGSGDSDVSLQVELPFSEAAPMDLFGLIWTPPASPFLEGAVSSSVSVAASVSGIQA